METILTHRGRPVTEGDVSFIRELLEGFPDDNRTAVSRRLCEAWGWRQPNGRLRDMVCRGLLLRLEREGLIRLPPKRANTGGWHGARNSAPKVDVDQSPVASAIKTLPPIELRQVRGTPLEAVHDSLIAEHHYLGYVNPVGEHLKYIALAGEKPLACLTWSSAPRHIGCRDRFIGWDAPTRRANIHMLAYNTRFLIPPWVHVHCRASHLLGKTSRTISMALIPPGS
ncbi:MAG: DUF4338 domain-containing protein [Syntrophobacteraceae bacterium]|nr:DUF4338 domain-containing protein [Syntrophobacteraceae bacterium]